MVVRCSNDDDLTTSKCESMFVDCNRPVELSYMKCIINMFLDEYYDPVALLEGVAI